MADEYDFQINSLKFRAAISDQFPYARSTAPFRKEQFDSAPTVGDQSLAGWWTRGQLSFHGGAGTRFYEVLDGQDVLNTFWESSGVKVTTPGEVTLNHGFVNTVTPATVARAVVTIPYSWRGNPFAGVWYRDAFDENLKAAWDTNDYADFPDATPATQSTNGTPDSSSLGLATDGKNSVWVVTDPDGLNNTSDIEVADIDNGGSVVIVYEHTALIRDVYHIKGRLFVVDENWDLYVVEAKRVGPATGLGTPEFRLPNGYTSFSASPADVYFTAETNQVFRMGLDDTGAVVSLASPIIAAELPIGESIFRIRYYLGVLVVSTNRGIRVAEVQGDGSLLFGPLLFGGPVPLPPTADFMLNQGIAVFGTSAYVPHYDDPADIHAGVALYEIDLSRPDEQRIGDFPWSKFATLTTIDIHLGGAVETSRGFVVWADGGFRATGEDLVTQGWVTTGYHRLGTLDPKSFRTISVRCGGDGGSIDVYRVDIDETETLLGNITPAEGTKDLAIGLDSPVERIAFKFMLKRDGVDTTLGPKLLGYQVKALPSPDRQRILKWPLSIADANKLRRGTSVGRPGQAYADEEALEDLETSDAVVTFTDHRTGETGKAYIDSVEFQSDTPPSATTDGFGGIAYVTLRVLD